MPFVSIVTIRGFYHFCFNTSNRANSAYGLWHCIGRYLDVPLDGCGVGEDLAADVAGSPLLRRVHLHLVTPERNVTNG